MAVRVVDASALVEIVLNTDLGRRVGEELREHRLAAPAHVDAEVLSAIGRMTRAREVSAASAESALRQLTNVPLHRYAVHPLLEASWEMRDSVALRDAIYVALARRLEAPVVTTDGALTRATGLGVTFVLAGD